jgi:C1A family cysteine protease
MATRRPFGVSAEELHLLKQQIEANFAALPFRAAAPGMTTPEDFATSLTNKRFATPEELLAYFVEEDQPHIEVEGSVFRLQREDETDSLSPEEIELAAQERLLWDEQSLRPKCSFTPAVVDHRPDQTGIRNQEHRGTCVCFASLACLEAIFQRQGTTLDLSEQYANWLFMKFQGRDQCDDGLKTTDAASYLSQKGVCEEALDPYEDDAEVNLHCAAQPTALVQQQARYGVGQYVIIDRPGLNGPSIANTAYLECLLSQGYDIVFGMHVAWGLPDADGVFDLIRDVYGNPLRSRGGHAMLLVGYDRSAPLPYFIFKNSWGSTGASGYYYLSYDYVRYYSKYGYVVLAASKKMVESTHYDHP